MVGVAQRSATRSSWSDPTRFSHGFMPFHSRVDGDGQNENPLALMRRAAFLRREDSCLNVVAHSSKVGSDGFKSKANKTSDVFDEQHPRTYLDNQPSERGPQVARIIGSKTLSGVAERLAGNSSRDAKNSSAQAAALKGSEIVPNNSPIQGLVFHPGHEKGRRTAFPLNVSHGA